MNKGSRGPHVTLIHALLCGSRYGKGIVFDQDYGEVTAAGVSDFQQSLGVEPDGHFGPQTRAFAKLLCDFDFNSACRAIPGTTEFVQPDGQAISWSPNE